MSPSPPATAAGQSSPRRSPPWAWPDYPTHKPYVSIDRKDKPGPEENIPAAFESFLLGPGEKKVEMKIDTRMANTCIFTFNKEDHTLGNLLRSKLLTNSHVTFAAYKVPHPLFPKFELHVRTDGEITPKEALLGTCRDLVNELSQLSREFTKEYELRKLAGGAQNGQ